jgi:Flp pilus assembly protein TadB
VEDDGLMLSPAPVKVIELRSRSKSEQAKPKPEQSQLALADIDAAQNAPSTVAASAAVAPASRAVELDWLSQPLSSRGIAWSINALAVLAALLLCVLVFISVTRESPRWPTAMVAGAAIFVAVFYWGFFKLFGGASPGVRLARLAGYDDEGSKQEGVFSGH